MKLKSDGYLIQVNTTPQQLKDRCLYYWMILQNGCNAGFGWAKSIEDAWNAALKFYRNNYLDDYEGGNDDLQIF